MAKQGQGKGHGQGERHQSSAQAEKSGVEKEEGSAKEQVLIYGATGYLGRKVLQQALDAGLNPIIGGRSVVKLRTLSEEYHVPWCLIDLTQPQLIHQALSQVKAVYCATPLAVTEGLIDCCAELPVTFIAPGFLSLSRLKGRLPHRLGCTVLTNAGFHTAVAQSLLTLAQEQYGPLSCAKVCLMGLPIHQQGYFRFLRTWFEHGGQSFSEEAVSQIEALDRRWLQALERSRGGYKAERVQPRVLPSFLSRQGIMDRWYHLPMPELALSKNFAVPVTASILAGHWWLPILAMMSAPLRSVPKPEPAQQNMLKQWALRQWVAPLFEETTSGLTALMKRWGRRSDKPQGSASVIKQRTGVWCIVEDTQGRAHVMGLEGPDVYAFTAQLAVQAMSHIRQSRHIGVGMNTSVLPAGLHTANAVLGPDWVMQVAGALRFGVVPRANQLNKTTKMASA